jgi:two-component system, cell cycle sensor histidine kinase and response regulator CckA
MLQPEHRTGHAATPPPGAIGILLASTNGVDRALLQSRLAQTGRTDVYLDDVLPVVASLVQRAAALQDAVCLADEACVQPGALFERMAATGCPVIVLTDDEDIDRDCRLIASGAWDCVSRSALTAAVLVRSVLRAAEDRRRNRGVDATRAALASSEVRFRALVHNAAHGILHTTEDWIITGANPALTVMLGYESEDEVVGRNILELFRDPAERERVVTELHQSGNIGPVELQWRRRNGTPFWARLSGRAPELDDEKLPGFAMMVEDVTEHRLLESQLHQAQKMEAIGRLAGGVAHDFNNLLTAMIGYGQMLRDQIDRDDPRFRYADEICRAAERGSALTGQLLTFTRKPVGELQALDLNAVVNGFERMLRRLIGEDVELQTVLGESLGFVRANPGQIEQVIMNLAINGRDAMAGGGTLIVETANVELDQWSIRTHASLRPGPYVMISVTDTGSGIPPEIRAHLFEPFFTTKEAGRGSGLGLATVYGIVRRHGGHIYVYSEVGKGSTFKIYLPRVAAPEQAVASPAEPCPALFGSETILLVEDDPSVRSLATNVLQGYGYRVVVASDGREGLAVASTCQEGIDLVVTDVVMPGMGGHDMVRRLWWTRPRTRVLYLSGYTDQAGLLMGLREPWTSFLQKPFTPEEMAAAVRQALDQKLTTTALGSSQTPPATEPGA